MDDRPIEFTNWVRLIDQTADNLINLGPKKKRRKRSDAIKEIVETLKQNSLFFVTHLKDPRSFAEAAVFQFALLGKGNLLPEKLSEFVKSFQAYKTLKRYISEEIAQIILKRLKEFWRKDPAVLEHIQTIEQSMKKMYKGVLPVKEKVPRRRKDLFLDGLLIQCHLAYDKDIPYGGNGRVAEFVNAVYSEEIFPLDTGAERVRKRIEYIIENADGETENEKYDSLERQWREVTDSKKLNVGGYKALKYLGRK